MSSLDTLSYNVFKSLITDSTIQDCLQNQCEELYFKLKPFQEKGENSFYEEMSNYYDLNGSHRTQEYKYNNYALIKIPFSASIFEILNQFNTEMINFSKDVLKDLENNSKEIVAMLPIKHVGTTVDIVNKVFEVRIGLYILFKKET